MTSTFVPNSAKSKFIVVDQSLRDLHGHHFVYSTSVAEAAAQRGFVSVILAHRRFDRCLQPDNINVIPWFRYAWYERRGEALLRSFVFRILALLRPGPRDHIYVFLRRLRRRVAEHKALDAPATRMPANFASPVFQAILESSFGVFPRVLVAVLYVLARTATRTVRTISPGNTNRSGFGATVMRGLTHVGAKKEDRVFIHTLSVNELESLLEAMLAADLDGVAHFHILLRGDPREPSLAHGGYHGIAICLGRFHACGLWPRHVTFFTDTEELRALYNALSPIRFIKAPIPVRRDLFHDGPRDGPATRARARKYRGRPINITYLGGARTEKGFHHLPQVVSVLWVDYVAPGKARFTIQSNFNVPGGEPGMAIAKSRLAKLPDDAVTLITRAMSEEDYQEILASSDVVILPYDQTPMARAARVFWPRRWPLGNRWSCRLAPGWPPRSMLHGGERLKRLPTFRVRSRTP